MLFRREDARLPAFHIHSGQGSPRIAAWPHSRDWCAISEPYVKVNDMTTNQKANANTLPDRSIRAMAQKGGPKGDRLAGYAGPGTLRPGVGQLVQRSGQPQYCGAMAGIAMAVIKSPNPRDPSRTSTRFIGDCMAIRQNGQVLTVGEFFLPGTPTRIIEASLAHSGEGVPFCFDIWCEPDPEGRPRSPLGYSFVTYNRRARAPNDPVLALAYESGLIEPPAGDGGTLLLGANGARAHPDDVDPATGEVIERAEGQSAGNVEQSPSDKSASKVSGKRATA